uniref:SecA family profile domain-containing protein n=1 Tax=Lactuca sativa TaxID=4236 RepID=A0A9R1W6B8_LACSA|nr:hypothetical protein LSAT_V11C300114490 [Lactuca sativa]
MHLSAKREVSGMLSHQFYPFLITLLIAIVDELDYVLIDEGRNPLLISGEASKDAARNTVAAKVAELLMRGLVFYFFALLFPF